MFAEVVFERKDYGSEVLYEAYVKVGETQEALKIFNSYGYWPVAYGCQLWPVAYGCHFPLVQDNAFFGDIVIEELNGGLMKTASFSFAVEGVLSQVL